MSEELGKNLNPIVFKTTAEAPRDGKQRFEAAIGKSKSKGPAIRGALSRKSEGDTEDEDESEVMDSRDVFDILRNTNGNNAF